MTKVHRIMQFRQSGWMRLYIDMYTWMRMKASNESEANRQPAPHRAQELGEARRLASLLGCPDLRREPAGHRDAKSQGFPQQAIVNRFRRLGTVETSNS